MSDFKHITPKDLTIFSEDGKTVVNATVVFHSANWIGPTISVDLSVDVDASTPIAQAQLVIVKEATSLLRQAAAIQDDEIAEQVRAGTTSDADQQPETDLVPGVYNPVF